MAENHLRRWGIVCWVPLKPPVVVNNQGTPLSRIIIQRMWIVLTLWSAARRVWSSTLFQLFRHAQFKNYKLKKIAVAILGQKQTKKASSCPYLKLEVKCVRTKFSIGRADITAALQPERLRHRDNQAQYLKYWPVAIAGHQKSECAEVENTKKERDELLVDEFQANQVVLLSLPFL